MRSAPLSVCTFCNKKGDLEQVFEEFCSIDRHYRRSQWRYHLNLQHASYHSRYSSTVTAVINVLVGLVSRFKTNYLTLLD